MKKILITGGAGFIGSHLSEYLLKDRKEVTVVDNLSTGSVRNVEHLEKEAGFHLVVDSVLDTATIEPLIREADMVYHLGAAVGVKLIVEDPVGTIETNIRGTEVVLEMANKWRKPVVLTSTSEVYGKNANCPFKEDDDMVLGATTNTRWSYACSKAIDEFLAVAYHRNRKLPTLIVRLFNTVGPRQTSQYGMVLPTFVRQALRGMPITVYGDGSQTRTFTYVSDVVEALATLPQHEKAFGQVFNLGGNQEISIMNLAKLVKERTGSKSEVVTIPYDQAYAPGFEDMPRRVPDISKAKKFIGYEPRVSLEEIINRVIDHFKNDPSFV